MAVRRFAETDVIEVKTLNTLIWGNAGVGKTSTAQTATSPFTLDFDKGIHRSAYRKTAVQIDEWADLQDPGILADILAHKTIIVDTVGGALELLAGDVLKTKGAGNPSGGLSKNGWGALKNRFAQWVAFLRRNGKDVVFICHSKGKEKGEDSWAQPDVQGGTYDEVLKFMDLIGEITSNEDGSERMINFQARGKTPGKGPGWTTMAIPSFAREPFWLEDVLIEAKKLLGNTAVAAAASAQAIKEWTDFLAGKPTLEAFNDRIPLLASIPEGPAKRKIKGEMLREYTQAQGWVFNRTSNAFTIATTSAPLHEGNGALAASAN